MTSIKLLHVSALGCHPQGVFQIKRIRVSIQHRPTRHPPRVSSGGDPFGTQRPRQTSVCLLLTEYKQLRACTWKGRHVVSISQHCNVMLISFMCFQNLNSLITSIRAMHTQISVLGLHSFDMKDSLRIAPRCRNMQGINICHTLYFIKCIG